LRFVRAHPLQPELLYAIKYFLKQRGPTTSELWAILQKRDNSRSTSNQMMHRMDRTTDPEQFKLKKGKASEWVIETTANSNLLQICISEAGLHCFKTYVSYRTELFLKQWICYGTVDLKSNPVDSSHFENNFKRTINCPATRAIMNEPSKQMTYWRYQLLCDVCYSTMEILS